MRALCVSDILTVQVDVSAACDAEEGYNVAAVRSIRTIGLEECPVYADEIVLFARILPARTHAVVGAVQAEDLADFVEFRDLRRIVRELVSQIDVERFVVAAELPARRNVDLIKCKVVRVEYVRQVRRFRIENEIPVTVQADDLRRFIPLVAPLHFVCGLPVRIRNKIAPRSQLIVFEYLKIAVIRLVDPVSHQ